MLTDKALVDLLLLAQDVERRLRAAQTTPCGEGEDIRDALRHATVTRQSLEKWVVKRKVREARAQAS
jgi:hypothetical protein